MPSRFGQTLGSTASGALAGGSVAGVPGAIVGGTIGFLTGILSETPEEKRQRRINQYRARMREIKAEETKAVIENISQTTEGLQRRMGGGAARRALAQGRLGDVEEVTAPIAGDIANRAVGVRTQAMADLESRYAQAELGLEEGIFEAPLEPTAVDYLQAITPAAVEFGGMQRQGELNERILNEQEKDSQFYRDLYQREFGGAAPVGSAPSGAIPGLQRETLGQLMLPEATTVSPIYNYSVQAPNFERLDTGDVPYEYDLTNPRNRRNLMRRRIG